MAAKTHNTILLCMVLICCALVVFVGPGTGVFTFIVAMLGLHYAESKVSKKVTKKA